MLRSLLSAESRQHQFFEVRYEPIPNWTSHLLLSALLFVLPPLLVAKVLVTIYILLFAAAMRYFCAGFGPECRPLSLLGLLFVFNRCLWLGFFNYLLSMGGFLFVLGFWLRRRGELSLLAAACLNLLLLALFFTHLVGFILTVGALIWLAVTMGPRRWPDLGLLAMAILPGVVLTLDYLDRSGFAASTVPDALLSVPGRLLSGGWWIAVWRQLVSLNDELYLHRTGRALFGFAVLALCALSLMVSLCSGRAGGGSPEMTRKGADAFRSPIPIAILAALLMLLFVLLPDHLGEQGGFLKARLAPVPPLLLLGCMRELPRLRIALRATAALLIALNLGLVVQRIDADNGDLAEYTGSQVAAGSGRTWFVMQQPNRSSRNPGRELASVSSTCLAWRPTCTP